MLVADLPEAAGVWISGHAFEHDAGRAIREGAVDDVGVAGDPADIGRAPEDVVFLEVKDVFMRHRGPEEIAAGGVQHAFGLARGTGRVQNEQRVLGAHRLGRAIGGDGGADFMEPVVTAFGHRDVGARALYDEHFLDGATGDTCSFVSVHFQGNGLAAAQAFVGRDENFRAAIYDAASERFGREAAEDDRVDGPDARAGEHGIGGLKDHRHVDGDAVALPDAEFLQDVGELAHGGVEVAVGDRVAVARIIALPDEGGLVAAGFEVAVDAVGGDVEDAVRIPAHVKVSGFPGDVFHNGVGCHPVEALALLTPEGGGVCDRGGVHLPVFLRGEVGLARKRFGNGIGFRRIAHGGAFGVSALGYRFLQGECIGSGAPGAMPPGRCIRAELSQE